MRASLPTPTRAPAQPFLRQVLLLWLAAFTLWNAQAAETKPPTLGDLPNTVNIHHQPQYCSLCHRQGANGIIPSQVVFATDYQTGCRCHYRTPDDLRHPTDVLVPNAMRPKVPADFPLREGRLTCVSCHSFALLCPPQNRSSSSLRGAPYPDRTAFCFRCHDERQYVRLNPHHQLDETGKVVAGKCLFCHTEKPNETVATFATVKLIGTLEMLCQGCHNIGDHHPAGKPHFVRPTLESQVRMRQIEDQYGIILPRDPDGRLTCITCHNPHEPGVIPETSPAAKGAGEKLRHRLPKVLCAECHFHSLSSGPKR